MPASLACLAFGRCMCSASGCAILGCYLKVSAGSLQPSPLALASCRPPRSNPAATACICERMLLLAPAPGLRAWILAQGCITRGCCQVQGQRSGTLLRNHDHLHTPSRQAGLGRCVPSICLTSPCPQPACCQAWAWREQAADPVSRETGPRHAWCLFQENTKLGFSLRACSALPSTSRKSARSWSPGEWTHWEPLSALSVQVGRSGGGCACEQ